MKKLITYFILIAGSVILMAQAPESFNYQAILRDEEGNIRASTEITLEISILQGHALGTQVYTETHLTSTNTYGMVNLNIGSLNPDAFKAIDWSNGPYYMKISVDGNVMGRSKLLSVPYALYANSSGSAPWNQSGDNLSYSDGNVGVGTSNPAVPLQVQVNNNGLNIPVLLRNENGSETGGNSVGIGFLNEELGDWTKAAIVHERKIGYGVGTLHFLVDNDLDDGSVTLSDTRMSITSEGNVGIGINNPDDPLEVNGMIYSHTGGFRFPDGTVQTSAATGGGDGDNDPTNELQTLTISEDTIYLSEGGYVKLPELSGFSGDFNDLINKPEIATEMYVLVGIGAGENTPSGKQITAIGRDALKNNAIGAEDLNDGNYNVAVGNSALYSNTFGFFNTAVGNCALYSNTSGNSNSAFGYGALFSNDSGMTNMAVGRSALYKNVSGNFNSAGGYRALYFNTIGSGNSAFGYDALRYNTEGNYNTAFGNAALNSNTTGYYNAATGYQAGFSVNTGSLNTLMGYNAGYNITTGSNNIAIGYDAQVPDGTASNQVRIGNSAVTYAGIEVAWMYTSDIRKKESIRDLPYGIDFVNRLRPVDYIRKNNTARTLEAGFIAQDVEKLLKEMGLENNGMISTGNDNMLELRYNDFIPILTKAIQEQQEMIEDLKKEIEILKSK